LMQLLGAYDAINFDGGGSTALAVQGANVFGSGLLGMFGFRRRAAA
jgi:exopolysaccharide biosynthesis protein